MGSKIKKLQSNCGEALEFKARVSRWQKVEKKEGSLFLDRDFDLDCLVQLRIVSISSYLSSVVAFLEIYGDEGFVLELLAEEGVQKILSDMERAALCRCDIGSCGFSPIEYVESYISRMLIFFPFLRDLEVMACTQSERQMLLSAISKLIGSVVMFCGVIKFNSLLAKEIFIAGLEAEFEF